MNQETYSKVLTGIFGTFVTGMMIANLSSPAAAFSETENRTLAQEPELTRIALVDGSYMGEYETYLTDQFFGRDYWVALKSTMEKALMKQENNSVYFGANDTLINHFAMPDQDGIATRAAYMNSLVEKTDLPVYMGLIPTSASVWADRLPMNAPSADEVALIQNYYGQLSDNITTVPIQEHLSAHSHEDVFYRTDHHWTTLGSYYGYTAIAEAMGFDPVPLSNYTETVVSDSFFGTTYSSSGVRWVKPDSMSIYVPEDGVEVVSYATGMPSEGMMYYYEHLDIKDKYKFYLGDQQPLIVLKTEHTDAPKLLIVRDSNSDCLTPFLTSHFSEIHLLDLRYYNIGVSSYAASNSIDDILVLYSNSNYFSDINLFKLGL